MIAGYAMFEHYGVKGRGVAAGALQNTWTQVRSGQIDIGWAAPWFVAQVSYHVPGDESSPDIRTAQASLWKDGIALEGPDTDALKGEMRDNGGKGVHFSGPGLRAHAVKWAEKVRPWLERQVDGQEP